MNDVTDEPTDELTVLTSETAADPNDGFDGVQDDDFDGLEGIEDEGDDD